MIIKKLTITITKMILITRISLTYYSESNALTGRNASTPTSHTGVVCGGPSMNCWVAVGLGHPTSMLQPFIDTLTTVIVANAPW